MNEQQNDLIVSSEKLSRLFAEVIGWYKKGNTWYDPKGRTQIRIPDYANSDVLAWGALESLGAAVGYAIVKPTGERPVYTVTVGTGPDDKFRASHRQLARAICTAVCLHKRLLPENGDKPTADLPKSWGYNV